MKLVDQEVQRLSVESLESTFRKLAKAYQTMSEKGSNTTLVKKRRDAVKIGLDSLKNDWYGDVFGHEEEMLATAKEVLQSTIPSIEKQLAKAKEGSAQKTVNERRLTALQLAVASLENRLI